MGAQFITWTEIEADALLLRSGRAILSNRPGDIKRSADYVLQLAERIKNERASATLDFAAQAASESIAAQPQGKNTNG